MYNKNIIIIIMKIHHQSLTLHFILEFYVYDTKKK